MFVVNKLCHVEDDIKVDRLHMLQF